jgi:GxxExxY protein
MLEEWKPTNSPAKSAAMHEAQLLSYLRMSGRPVGLLINFHVKHRRHGLVNRFHG